MAGNKFWIINTQTGEKKFVRDNLFESHFRKFKSNGKEIWRKRDEIAKESLGEESKEVKEVVDNKEIALLKARISELESELSVCKNVNFPTKTDEKEVTINPFDIIEPSLLTEWLISNNIPFPKTIKKLDTLRKHIPEIYKK